jgi:hypothetical protein
MGLMPKGKSTFSLQSEQADLTNTMRGERGGGRLREREKGRKNQIYLV